MRRRELVSESTAALQRVGHRLGAASGLLARQRDLQVTLVPLGRRSAVQVEVVEHVESMGHGGWRRRGWKAY